jgi:hypothetical protein
MKARDFDGLTRIFAASSTRRGLVAFTAAFAGFSARDSRAAQLSNGACGVAGEVCTLLIGCCEGLTCATSTINTNYGVCVTGGSGGTMAVTDSIIAPTTTETSTQMDALAQEIAASATTSTTATDPNADQQARRDARQSKRSSRRSTRKSNNTTQQTNRKSRRDTHQLNAAPQLILESFTGQGDGEVGDVTEIVKVTNLDTVSIVLSRVEANLNPGLADTLSVTIAAGSSYLLESGVIQPDPGDDEPVDTETPDASLGTIWTEDSVCGDSGAGYTIVAAQSGATTTYEFDVLCGQVATFANPGNGNKHQNQRQQRRRHRRAQRKHNKNDHHGK